MKLTTKGRYAVTAMLDLALHNEDGEPVSLAAISERQQISLSYLEQLFAKLRRHDLVASLRGPGGGYRLSRAPNEIAVADIIKAVDESVDVTQCGGKKDCKGKGRCLTHELWSDLSNQINDFLSGISLKDMMTRGDVVEVTTRQNERLVRG